jgi:hypothetical protein
MGEPSKPPTLNVPKFGISIQEDDTADDSTIMIGSDIVSITAIYQNVGTCATSRNAVSNYGGIISTSVNGLLLVSSEPATFPLTALPSEAIPFAAFKNGFAIESIATLNIDNPSSSMAIVRVASGEAWELV